MSELLDRVRGALLGGLCGDAIGRPAECLSYQEIAARYGRITGPLEQQGRKAGDATDDSALKHMLCEAIVRAQAEVAPADWAAVWRERMSPDGFWVPVQNAYFRLMVQNITPDEVGTGTMVSNSSAMCIAPIGIVNAGNPAAACREALSAARLIHRGFPLEAAGAVAAAVAEAMRAAATPDTVLAASISHLPPDSEMIPAIQAGMALAYDSTGYEDYRERFYATLLRPWPHRHAGWSIAVDPRETVPAALGVFYLAGGDPTQTILGCANFGRDADTIATIGGAIGGALRGAEAIPAEWIDVVCAATPVNQAALAESLLRVLQQRAERASAWSGEVIGRLGAAEAA